MCDMCDTSDICFCATMLDVAGPSQCNLPDGSTINVFPDLFANIAPDMGGSLEEKPIFQVPSERCLVSGRVFALSAY